MAPLTPLRRLLPNVEVGHGRPIYSLRKRNTRQETSLPSNMHVSIVKSFAHGTNEKEASGTSGAGYPSTMISSPPHVISTNRASVALQQEDEPFDAVVISALPCYPFCCHEDLILMSRQRLVEVAQMLNMHLPMAMKIEVSETVTDACIRHAIEILVGIVPNTPAAPKPSRSWPRKRQEKAPALHESESDEQTCILPSPPSSPLAKRVSRRRGFSLIRTPPRMLERLDEEDEGSHSSDKRPLKKRKVSDDKATTTRFLYELVVVAMDISPAHAFGTSSKCRTIVHSDRVGSGSGPAYSSPININRTAMETSSGTFHSYLAARGSGDTVTSHGNPNYFQNEVGVEHMTRMDIG